MNINKNKKITNCSYFVDKSNEEIVKIINESQNKQDINNHGYHECYSSNNSEKDEKLTQTMSNVNTSKKNDNTSINNQSSSKVKSAIQRDKRSSKSIEN